MTVMDYLGASRETRWFVQHVCPTNLYLSRCAAIAKLLGMNEFEVVNYPCSRMQIFCCSKTMLYRKLDVEKATKINNASLRITQVYTYVHTKQNPLRGGAIKIQNPWV